jgi:SH3-like domain-containing protein
MSGVVTVKSSPDKSGTDLFQLHEGTKVSLKSTLGDWIEIRLGNGSIGWVKQECLEKI